MLWENGLVVCLKRMENKFFFSFFVLFLILFGSLFLIFSWFSLSLLFFFFFFFLRK